MILGVGVGDNYLSDTHMSKCVGMVAHICHMRLKQEHHKFHSGLNSETLSPKKKEPKMKANKLEHQVVL